VVERAKNRTWFIQHQLSPEMQKAWQDESMAVMKKYYPSGGPLSSPARPFGVNLTRLFAIISAVTTTVGLWLIALQEPRKDSEPSSVDNTASPSSLA
jgi:hypothetical protein